MSVTDFLSIFKHLSPHHSQIMACPVLIRTSSNTLPAPQKHIGSGCLLHMVIIWHQQQSHTCTVVPLAVSCRHSVVCWACCCPSSQSWYVVLSLLGALLSQWHALLILQMAKTYPNATLHGRWVDDKGVCSGAWISISLRTRKTRDTNSAVNSDYHWVVLSHSSLVRSACKG